MRDEKDISAEVMAEMLTDTWITTWDMFEELEYIHNSDRFDNETIDEVLRILTSFDFTEIKIRVEERIRLEERIGKLA